MESLLKSAAIDNKLTGHVKLANEDANIDEKVQLMGSQTPTAPPANRSGASPRPSAAGSSTSTGKTPPPAGLSDEVIKQTESLTKKATPPK
jgi:hypothetical protein